MQINNSVPAGGKTVQGPSASLSQIQLQGRIAPFSKQRRWVVQKTHPRVSPHHRLGCGLTCQPCCPRGKEHSKDLFWRGSCCPHEAELQKWWGRSRVLSPPAWCPISLRMCCSHHGLVRTPPPGGVSTRQGPICKDSRAFSSPSVVKFLKSGQEFVPCLHPQEARASPEEVRADSQKCDPSSQQCEHNSECAVGSPAAPGVAAMTPQSAALPREEQSKEEEPGGASAALRQRGLVVVQCLHEHRAHHGYTDLRKSSSRLREGSQESSPTPLEPEEPVLAWKRS